MSIGSNLFGSIDDIEECTKIAKEHNMWVHVESAFFFAKKQINLQNIDSIAI